MHNLVADWMAGNIGNVNVQLTPPPIDQWNSGLVDKSTAFQPPVPGLPFPHPLPQPKDLVTARERETAKAGGLRQHQAAHMFALVQLEAVELRKGGDVEAVTTEIHVNEAQAPEGVHDTRGNVGLKAWAVTAAAGVHVQTEVLQHKPLEAHRTINAEPFIEGQGRARADDLQIGDGGLANNAAESSSAPPPPTQPQNKRHKGSHTVLNEGS